jgi:FkbM family methyltransferase
LLLTLSVKTAIVVILLCVVSLLAFVPGPDRIRWLQRSRLLLTSRDSLCSLKAGIRAISFDTSGKSAAETRLLRQMRLTARAEDQMELWETPFGKFWIPKDNVGSLAYLLTEVERRVNGDGERGVRPGDIVLDCGANLGTFTREALRAGAATVVAIEPAPENWACLLRTFAEEIQSGRVVVYRKGVWDHDDQLLLNLSPGGTGKDSVVFQYGDQARGTVVVPLTTIDKLVSELKLDHVDFIKMDIEGAERNALAGARTTLRRFRPRMAISGYHRPDDTRKLPAVVGSIEPAYSMSCDECVLHENDIVPETLFFRCKPTP